MNSKYLFYFCEGIGTVFDSQVLTLITALNDKKCFNAIYLYLGVNSKDQRNALSRRNIPPEIKVVFFKTYPNYPFFNYLNRRNIRSALFEPGIKLKEVIFHSRGEMMAWHLSKVLDAKYHSQIIPDVRGASVEEIEEFYNVNKILKALKIRNIKESIKNLNRFHKISVVSSSLKEYLISNYNIDGDKINIVPCLSGGNFILKLGGREQIRKELGLTDKDLLIVYSSGGTAAWQNDRIVNLLAEKGLRILNLSKKSIPHKNVINKFSLYSEVPAYLNAADIAIIWRENSTVNRVASPVKFSEFIACGLPVISNHCIDMVNDYITRYCCGVLMNSIDEIKMSTLNDLRQKNRKQISESGILNFGVDAIVSKYCQIYDEQSNYPVLSNIETF